MKIENYGIGERSKEAMRRLCEAAALGEIPDAFERIILLPIPSARDGVHISGSDRLLSELFEDSSDGDLIVGYGIPTDIADKARAGGAVVFDAGEDEDFLLENAELTAVGTVGYILSEFGKCPRDMTFGIIGYGRIGAAVLRYLLFFGARVRVYTSKPETRVELGKCGVESELFDYGGEIPSRGIDVFINTAPRDMSAAFCASPKEMPRIIELASGDNFRGVDGVVRLPGIPEKFYPKSAGAAYFGAIQKYLSEVYSL